MADCSQINVSRRGTWRALRGAQQETDWQLKSVGDACHLHHITQRAQRQSSSVLGRVHLWISRLLYFFPVSPTTSLPTTSVVRVVRSVRDVCLCVYMTAFERGDLSGWRDGAMVDRRTHDQEVATREFDPRSGRRCVTTLGKLFTPIRLDADSLRYYMNSLNRILYFKDLSPAYSARWFILIQCK